MLIRGVPNFDLWIWVLPPSHLFHFTLTIRSLQVMGGLKKSLLALHDDLADIKAEIDSCRNGPPDELGPQQSSKTISKDSIWIPWTLIP